MSLASFSASVELAEQIALALVLEH